MEVLHTAIWVSDLEQSKEFYLETLGLEHSRQVEGNEVIDYFIKGETSIELQLKYDRNRSVEIEPSGIDHIALEVDDVDACFDQIHKEWDSNTLTEPTSLHEHKVRYAMLTDPDGYIIEIMTPL